MASPARGMRQPALPHLRKDPLAPSGGEGRVRGAAATFAVPRPPPPPPPPPRGGGGVGGGGGGGVGGEGSFVAKSGSGASPSAFSAHSPRRRSSPPLA